MHAGIGFLSSASVIYVLGNCSNLYKTISLLNWSAEDTLLEYVMFISIAH